MSAHVDSDLRCLFEVPPCVKCRTCGQFIRPEKMQEECPGGVSVRALEDFNEYDRMKAAWLKKASSTPTPPTPERP